MEFQRDTALRAIFEHSSVGIIISGADGVILEANPFASKMFGYEITELTNQKVEVLLPPRIHEKHVVYREGYNKKPEPRAMGTGRELSAIRKNGVEFPVEVSLSSFKVEDKLRIVSFINDVTDKQKYRQKLESLVEERTQELSGALVELNSTNEHLREEMKTRKIAENQARESLKRERELSELKSRFVSMASHEFRTPLAGIMTSVSLLQKYTEPGFEEKRDKHFKRIKSLIRNLTGILNDFLSIDKLEQGGVKVSPQKFEIKKFIETTVSIISETHHNEREIIQQFHFEEMSVFLDKEFLRNILTNLLTNALKYSDTQALIKVELSESAEQVILKVIDEGYGIPEADQKHLFERFFRANNVDTIQGTGLGLNIVKRYVSLMRGSISFSSQLNKGTIFTVTLPKELK